VQPFIIAPEDAERVFSEIDENGGGKILFDEFGHWAFITSLDSDPCDEDVDE